MWVHRENIQGAEISKHISFLIYAILSTYGKLVKQWKYNKYVEFSDNVKSLEKHNLWMKKGIHSRKQNVQLIIAK